MNLFQSTSTSRIFSSRENFNRGKTKILAIKLFKLLLIAMLIKLIKILAGVRLFGYYLTVPWYFLNELN